MKTSDFHIWYARINHLSPIVLSCLVKLCPASRELQWQNADIRWPTSWENLSLDVFNQVRLKPACSATEASKCVEIWDLAFICIILSRKRITDCESLICVVVVCIWYKHVFSWHGSDEWPLLLIFGSRDLGFESRWRQDSFEPKQCSIALSLSCSLLHPDMIEIQSTLVISNSKGPTKIFRVISSLS